MKIKMILYLKLNYLDKDLENPIGMAAGFDKNAEVYNSLFKLVLVLLKLEQLHL